MSERVIQLDGRAGPIHLRDIQGLPSSAQADEARVLLATHARPTAGSRVLDLGCGTGLCAIAAARAEPSATVVACDVDWRLCVIAASHAKENRVSNVAVEHSDGFDHLADGAFDEVLFRPPTHCSAATVKKLIAQSALRLRTGGRLWLATGGARGERERHRWAAALFSQRIETPRRRGCRVSCYVKADGDGGGAAAKAQQFAEEERHSFEVVVRGATFRFQTKVNVFSWDGLDPGTELLLKCLPQVETRRILDLGCGYGPIGIVAAHAHPGAEVTMSDVDRRALDLASANAEANGCAGVQVCASDGVADLRGAGYDLILSNLPTHVGKRQMAGLLRGARDRLQRGGTFVGVISKQLSVDRAAREVFGDGETVAESEGHSVFACRKP